MNLTQSQRPDIKKAFEVPQPSDQLKLGPTLPSKYSKNVHTAPTYHGCDECKNHPAQQLTVVHRFTKRLKTTSTARSVTSHKSQQI